MAKIAEIEVPECLAPGRGIIFVGFLCTIAKIGNQDVITVAAATISFGKISLMPNFFWAAGFR
jgi:hypothetical protein